MEYSMAESSSASEFVKLVNKAAKEGWRVNSWKPLSETEYQHKRFYALLERAT